MGEIKSTLELVMERTRNLTLSEEEKREQTISEFRKNLSGLLQKFQDKVLTLDHFERELQHLEETSQLRAEEIVIDEVGRRLDPDRDNERMLILLSRYCGAKVEGIASALSEYGSMLQERAEKKAGKLKEEISIKRGISGSAVIPNLEADAEWGVERRQMHDLVSERIKREVDKLRS